MAEKGEEDDESSGSVPSNMSSWWNSFYDTAKQKLSETNEFMMHDIQEFTQTVKSDTSKLVADTAASMKDQLNIKVNLDEASHATKVVTNSISGFLGKVVHHVTPIAPEENENQDSTVYLGTSSGVKVMSPAEARLFTLQTSPATYCNEPDNAIEFNLWLESFKLDAKKEELSLLMLDSKEVRTLYTKLVPEAVSHVHFWTRYFYKKSELEKAEQRRAMLVERAETKETELLWDDEDEYDVVDYPLPEQTVTEEADAETVDAANREKTIVKTEENIPTDVAKQQVEADKTIVQLSVADSVENKQADGTDETTDIKSCQEPTAIDVKDKSDIETDDLTSDVNASAEVKKEMSESGKVPSSSDKEVVEPNPTSTCVSSDDDAMKTVEEQKVVESSSGDSSDWEKEFDLEMTEDEIKEALLEDDDNEEIEGWEEWE